ncbi:MAG: phosphoribosylanthranilate isomerase [Woeseiaceae bacterium]|nr:phosphoribosylanthranilate isomerase [Woeseiaceae bacterium]
MSVLVKICGLSSAADVEAAVDAGANAVGFVFAESVRRVLVEQAAAATAQLRNDVRKVAVMRHPTADEWRDVLLTFRPDVLQTDIGDFDALDVPDSVVKLPVIREGDAAADGDLPDVFVYEGRQSGAGVAVDWQRAAEIAKRGTMILAGGISAANVAEAIATVRPFGVDVSSAVESEPGRKDPALIREFIDAVRAAEIQA